MKPTKPTKLIEPFEHFELTKPTKLIEPFEPIEHIELTKPTKPIEPLEHFEPFEHFELTKPSSQHLLQHFPGFHLSKVLNVQAVILLVGGE